MMKSKKIAKFAQRLFVTMAIAGVVCGSSMTANATELSEDVVPGSETVEEVAVEAVSELEEAIVEETLETTEAIGGVWQENISWSISGGVLTIENYNDGFFYYGGGIKTPESAGSDYSSEQVREMVAADYPWAAYKDSITKIVISNDVEGIGDVAFYNMNKVEEVVLGYSIEYIDDYVFGNCTSLKKITLPAKFEYMGLGAFYNCTALEEVNGNVKLGGYTFYGCSSLNKIVLPSNITYIPEYAFYGCSGLEEITIPEGVDYIGKYAFAKCTGLTSISIPEAVTEMEEYAFTGCTGLTAIIIPDLSEEMGEYAFLGCTGLKEVTFKGEGDWIGEYVFKDCTGITKVNLPKNGCMVSNGAFYNCTNLAEITGSVSYLGEYAFYNCKKLTNLFWTNELKYIGQYACYGCSSLKELNFSTYIYIDEYAFANCAGLNKVVFKEEIDGIAAYAFSECNLKEMWFEKEQYTLRSSVYDNVLEGNASCKVYGVYDSIPERIAEENNCTFVPTDKLPQPEMGTLSSAVNGLRVSWDKTDYALTYDVYRSTLVGGNYTLLKKGVSSTAYIDTTVTPGVKYYYKVIAVGELAKSEYSEASVAGMYLKAPTFKKMVNVVSGVHVYWNAAQGAKTYSVYRSTSKTSDFTLVKSGLTATHYIDTTAASGKTYYYKVLAVNGSYSTSSYVEPFKPYTYVGTPDITSRINKGAGIQLGWNKIVGATGYAIYRKPYEGGAWARITTISGNKTFTYTDTTVKDNNGTIYRYTVRALAGSDMKTLSGCRNTGRTMVRLSSRTLNSAVKVSATSIKCNWTTSSAVTGYEVRFMVGNSVYRTYTVGNYKTGVKTFTGLPSGNTYKIQVRAYKKVDGVGSFYSAWSTAKTVSL